MGGSAATMYGSISRVSVRKMPRLCATRYRHSAAIKLVKYACWSNMLGLTNVSFRRRFQRVDATHALNRSARVS